MDAFELIEEEIRKLNELRRMAQDPHMLEIMRKLTALGSEAKSKADPPYLAPRKGMLG